MSVPVVVDDDETIDFFGGTSTGTAMQALRVQSFDTHYYPLRHVCYSQNHRSNYPQLHLHLVDRYGRWWSAAEVMPRQQRRLVLPCVAAAAVVVVVVVVVVVKWM